MTVPNLVGNVPSDELGTWIDFLQKRRSGVITAEHFKEFVKLNPTPFAVPAGQAKREIEKFAAKLARRLSTVFRKRIILPPLPAEFTDGNLVFWATFNFHPGFLPDEEISETRRLKNWTKLSQWFYDRVGEGKIKSYENLSPTQLPGRWVLYDATVSADYTDGTQVFVNDPLAPIITDLREKKLIGKHDSTPMGSRFAITPDEWDGVVLTYVASKLGVTRGQMRLERAIEFNAIGNLYDANRGKFNAWEWFQDVFGDSYRLYGGLRDYGGLADVSYYWHDNRCGYIAARPLVCF